MTGKLLLPLGVWLFERVLDDFSPTSERDWVCFAKAARKVWARLHDSLALLANKRLSSLKKKVELAPLQVQKIISIPIIKNFKTEKPLEVTQLAQYSPGSRLAAHYAAVFQHKDAVVALLRAHIATLMQVPGFAGVVKEAPVLDAKNVMKSLNSLRSKLERECLQDADCALLFKRDVFRFRICLSSSTFESVATAVGAIHSLASSCFVLQRVKTKLTVDEYPKQLICNF